MAKEIQYVNGVKIVGRRHRHNGVTYKGKDAVVMDLLREKVRTNDAVFAFLRSFPEFETAYCELKKMIREAGYWHIDGLDFVVDLMDIESDGKEYEQGWTDEFEFKVRINEYYVLIAVPMDDAGFLCSIGCDFRDPYECEEEEE